MREFSAEQLKTYLDTCEKQPLLLDVRQPWEFDVCKIENSVLVPMSTIPAKIESLDIRSRDSCYMPPWHTQPQRGALSGTGWI